MNKYTIAYTASKELVVWANDQVSAELQAQAQEGFYSILSTTLESTFPYTVGQTVYAFNTLQDAIKQGVITDINFVSDTVVKLFVRFVGETSSTLYPYPFVNEGTSLYADINDILDYLGRDLPVLPPPIVPIAPSGVHPTSITATTLRLNWSLVLGATGYNIYQDNVLIDSNVQGTNAIVSNLAPGNAYGFQVSALNSAGESVKSAIYTATTLPSVPAAPTLLVVSNLEDTSLELSWTASSGATSYKVYANSALIAMTTVEEYAFSGLIPNTTYILEVTALNGGGESVASAEEIVTTLPPIPAAPTGLNITSITNTSFVLNWSPSTYATTYTVYVDGTEYADSITGTSLSIGSLDPATTYSLRVTATNSSGVSPLSTALSGLTLCSAPTGLSAASITDTTAQILWSASTGAATYNLYRNGSLIQSGITGTSYNASSLVAATTYLYRVSAVNPSGESTLAPQISVLTEPAAPANLLGTNITSSSVDLTWDAVTGASEYTVYRNGLVIASNVVTTSYAVSGLSANTLYEFIVTASNVTGESSNSNMYPVTTLP